mmetsp:Transcript_4400/g.11137  ORF Transcript_4400/g.11137 Transcript_4400/m.11137 type:complete len:267 (-) Transcript_4400:498-1298(-)
MVGFGNALSPLLLAFATSNNGNSSFEHEIMTTTVVKKMTYTGAIGGREHDAITKLRTLGMEKKESPRHASLRRASILVPLFERTNNRNDDDDVGGGGGSESSSSDIHVLFTQRPQRMKSHGGEVCFPGGKQDPDDGGDDVRTAMREAHEEIGLHPRHVLEVARMETVESKHGLCVTPIVGLVNGGAVEPGGLSLNEDEVEAAFAVPLGYFADPENCHEAEMVEWRGDEFLLRTYLYDDRESGRTFKIWGLTAHVVHLVATMAFCEK